MSQFAVPILELEGGKGVKIGWEAKCTFSANLVFFSVSRRANFRFTLLE